MNEPRTQNFRGISECTTKIQAQDCERTYLAASDIKSKMRAAELVTKSQNGKFAAIFMLLLRVLRQKKKPPRLTVS